LNLELCEALNYPVRNHQRAEILKQGLTTLGWTTLEIGPWYHKNKGRSLNMWCMTNIAGPWFSFCLEKPALELEVAFYRVAGTKVRCYAFEREEDAAVFKLANGGEVCAFS